jgi:hypothetical protein
LGFEGSMGDGVLAILEGQLANPIFYSGFMSHPHTI